MTYAYDAPATRAKTRRGGAAPSVDAWHAQVLPKLKEKQRAVFAVIEARAGGATAKEVAEQMGLALHHISGRCSEMKAAGLIRGTGVRRDGSEVLVSNRPRVPEQTSLFAA